MSGVCFREAGLGKDGTLAQFAFWVTYSVSESLKNRRMGAVGFCFESCCPMLGGCQKIKGQVFSSNEGIFIVYAWFCHSALQSFKCVYVCGVWTHCVCTQSSLSVFTMLDTSVRSSLHSVVKLTFYLYQTLSWFWLVINC